MITVVSLAWNKYDLTKEFLQRLKSCTDIPHHLVFTDNGSEEPISDLVRKYYPTATLIRKEQNVGCPATRNEAMREVKTDLCFWLDNDCMVDEGWYQPILDALKDPKVGLAGTQGYVVKNPWRQPFPFEPVKDGKCDYLMGWCVGFKRKAYQPINDYHIPVNLDDVELAWGIKASGYEVAVCPPIAATHRCSQTQRGWSFNDQEKLAELWSNWKDRSYLFERFK